MLGQGLAPSRCSKTGSSLVSTHLSQHWAECSPEEAQRGPREGWDTLAFESGHSIFGRKKILRAFCQKSTYSQLPHMGPDSARNQMSKKKKKSCERWRM